MRLLVSEFVCSGAWAQESLDSSLVAEGRSMLLAVLRDAVKIPELEVVTIWSAHRERFPVEGVAFQLTRSPEEEIEILAELAAWADVSLLIAPEFDGILTHRALLVEGVGGRLCGPSPLAITTCGDKFELASILQEAGILTIPTHEFSPAHDHSTTVTYPCVIKPRDGAGSQETYLVPTTADFDRLHPGWKKSSLLRHAIWQPYIAGRAVSVGVIVTPEQYRYQALPPCEQTLNTDGRFAYQGGVVPARGVDVAALQNAAIAACRQVPGLRGYVGVDLIIPDSNPAEPLIVEINPRITTSYLGYSRLCEQNLIASMLQADSDAGELTWKPEQLEYISSGEVRRIL
ncbi:MAG: carbamoyl phosphate synthase-like protein [Planctomycetaceae bacterium]|nr:carbamoyl phosphate synthase-like protein [Planctomycetaceae bacterium]